MKKVTGKPTLAQGESSALEQALVALSGDVSTLHDNADASAAFARWCAVARQHSGAHDELWDVFAGEVAFASAARLALEAEIGRVPDAVREAFPHLFGSELFGWYDMPDASRQLAREALSADEDPLELLGWLYQFSIPVEVRKRFGQFYTRSLIVRHMLDDAGFAGPAVLTGRLLDPACGAGAFLIEAARRVIAQAHAAGLRGGDAVRAVQSVVHGLDLNPLGVLLTEAAIALMLVEDLRQLTEHDEVAPLHLYITDSLADPLTLGETAAPAHDIRADELKLRVGEFAEGFSWVVANPPYAKFPTRNMTAGQIARFSKTTYGHPNLYGLFLQLGVELLADDGRLAFINPKSFVSGQYFRNLRRFLSAELDLVGFDSFTKRTELFPGVLQEVVILTGVKSAAQRETIRLREYTKDPSGAPAHESAAPAASVLLGESFDHSFFITADPVAHSLMEAMVKDSTPLSELGYEAVTGTIVWNRLKDHVRAAVSEDALPLAWGNGVRPFLFRGLGNRDGGATHMALVEKTKNIISTGPAIFVKRLTAKEEKRRIVACRAGIKLETSERGYFAENHLNIVRATKSAHPDVELDAVLGLLNSDLFDYVFRALNGNTQVSATEIGFFPVRLGPQLEEVAAAARRLTAAKGNDSELLAELNDAVFRLYDVSERDREALAAFYSEPTDAPESEALAA